MSFPNPWENPDFFERCEIDGRLMRPNLVEIGGLKVEHDWAVQRTIGQSGAVNVFKGTKPAGPVVLTFEIAGESSEDLVAQWDDLRWLYERTAPLPGMTASGQGTTIGAAGSAAHGAGYVVQSSNANPAPTVSADDLLRQAQAALAQLQAGGPAAAGPTAAGPVASILSPGPKPPTVTIKNGYLNYLGIMAISVKSWEGPLPTETNAQRVKVEVVLQKPPTKANVGPAAPVASTGGKTIAFGEIQGAQAAAVAFNQGAAGAGAGT